MFKVSKSYSLFQIQSNLTNERFVSLIIRIAFIIDFDNDNDNVMESLSQGFSRDSKKCTRI